MTRSRMLLVSRFLFHVIFILILGWSYNGFSQPSEPKRQHRIPQFLNPNVNNRTIFSSAGQHQASRTIWDPIAGKFVPPESLFTHQQTEIPFRNKIAPKRSLGRSRHSTATSQQVSANSLVNKLQNGVSSPQLYGLVGSGGVGGVGAIISTQGDSIKLEFSFPRPADGENPLYGQLLSASNGKFYGTTQSGGIHYHGIIFEFDTSTGTFVKIHDFEDINGMFPLGSLVEAGNGKFYGTTNWGGANNYGVIYEYDPVTDTYTKKYDFDNTNGWNPYNDMLKASNGKLYGTTTRGGTSNNGVIFEFDPLTDTFSKKHDFDGTNGSHPQGSLMEASNGKFYGMTSLGGFFGNGIIYEFDPLTDTFAKRLDFVGSNGQFPKGSLVQFSNGQLYGMTHTGGMNGAGVIFEYDPSAYVLTKKYDFADTDGKNPVNSMILSSNGTLVGTTLQGGANNAGVIFEYDPLTNTYTKKYDLDNVNGSYPTYTLIETTAGTYYGMTHAGGVGNGVLYKYDMNSNLFNAEVILNYAYDGSYPNGSLLLASNGKFYGMTASGGIENLNGVIFEYDPLTNIFTKKYDFDDVNGSYPQGSFIEADNGKLYGLTSQGGTTSTGVIFEYDYVADLYAKKFDFDNSLYGGYPYGSLLKSSNGKLYGMAYSGGSDNAGIIFEYDYNANLFTKKFDFNDTDGEYPTGDLYEYSNGKMYGMTAQGGANNEGVIFEFDPSTNVFTKKFDFDYSVSGGYPYGSLTGASNGKLYGVTSEGGTNNYGVIFEYDPLTNTYTKKNDFDNINGQYPYGSLTHASNNKFYGMASEGGAYNYGVTFEYDPLGDVFSKIDDFEVLNGRYPGYNNFTELILGTPDIDITGNSLPIVDGDVTPAFGNHTDFGIVNVGQNLMRMFTIRNVGTADLIIANIQMSGPDQTQFTIGGMTLPDTISSTDSATFTVTLTPLSGGIKSATVTVNNSDADESEYDFAVQGEGLNFYTLTVNATNGYVIRNPDQPTYAEGMQVIVTAFPWVGYHFTGWSGDFTGADNPDTIFIDGNKAVTANFAINTYSLGISGDNGAIEKNPDLPQYQHGQQVILTPHPATGFHFVNWTGDLTGNENPDTIVMDGNKTVTANFAINTYSLAISADNGSVIKNPDLSLYEHGQEVILTAVPALGFHFTHWTGDLTGIDNPDTILIDGNKSLTANFAINTYILTVIASHGVVTQDPEQLTYVHGVNVVLTATPDVGYQFAGWSGDASGSTNPLNITMDGHKSVTALFDEDPAFLIHYRSFSPESLAVDKDRKGKIGKQVTQKPDKVDYKFIMTVPDDTVQLKLKFSMLTSGALTRSIEKIDTIISWSNVKEIVTLVSGDSGDTIQIDGRGLKGKQIKTTYSWTRPPSTKIISKGTIVEYIHNIPRLPMPNRVNAVYQAFQQGGFAASAGLLVGKDRSLDSANYYGWLLSSKYTDVMKSMYEQKTARQHLGQPRGFELFENGKPFIKRQKTLEPKKHDNALVAEMIAIKLNIALSALQKNPVGFGELVYNDGEVNPLNGMEVKEIAAYGDSIMSGRYVGGVHSFADTGTFGNLYRTIDRINSAFEGELDTIDFSSKLIFKGVRKLLDVPYLRMGNSVPATIIPLDTRLTENLLEYRLEQNYPNPFNPVTNIKFDLPITSLVMLKIYNTLGQEVATIIDNEEFDHGEHEITFEAQSLSSGVYFYHLTANANEDEDENIAGQAYNSVKKMLLLK